MRPGLSGLCRLCAQWMRLDLGRRLWRQRWLVLLPVVLFALAACTQTMRRVDDNAMTRATRPKVLLLMPMDVTLARLTAGGVQEVVEEWTTAARRNLLRALRAELVRRDVRLVLHKAVNDEHAFDRVGEGPDLALMRLHRLVGFAILTHKFLGEKLPTKKGRFDWTLGKTAHRLSEGTRADHALFVFIHDTYSSFTRKLLYSLTAGLGLGIVDLGSTVGFASLVDLRTGQVVWFQVFSSEVTDLREEKGTRKLAHDILKGFPAPPIGPPPSPVAAAIDGGRPEAR